MIELKIFATGDVLEHGGARLLNLSLVFISLKQSPGINSEYVRLPGQDGANGRRMKSEGLQAGFQPRICLMPDLEDMQRIDQS